MSTQLEFVDLPRNSFPLSIELIDAQTRETVWCELVHAPGAVRIPHFTDINNGKPVDVRVTFGDGDFLESTPFGWLRY